MSGLMQDLRFGLRLIRRSPVFLLVAIASLSIGIGANTAIYSMLSELLFRELPIEQPERLAQIYRNGSRFRARQQMSYPDYQDLHASLSSSSSSSASVAAFTGREAMIQLPSGPTRVGTYLATANYLETVGVVPARGRWYTEDEISPVVVISHALWRKEYLGKDNVVGTTLHINTRPFDIIGILPDGFSGIDRLGDPNVVWVPMQFRSQILTGIMARYFEARTTSAVSVVARLNDSGTLEQLSGEIGAVANSLAQDHQSHEELGLEAAMVPTNGLDDSSRESLLTATRYLGAASAMILLIACINMASLLLSRGIDRTREVALRFALGADRKRITRQLLAENLIFAIPASLVAVACAFATRQLMWSLRPPLVAEDALRQQLDPGLLALTFSISVFTLLLFGTLPAITVARSQGGGGANISSVVKPAFGRRQARTRKLLIGAQVAIATVVVAGAVLTARSLTNLLRIDPGFVTTDQLLFSVDLEASGKTQEEGQVFYDEAMTRISGLPEVQSVALAHTFFALKIQAGVASAAQYDNEEWFPSGINTVSPNYFECLEIPLLVGRPFDSRDRAESAPVAVVNLALAERAFPDQDPIGQRLYFMSQWHEVVGVVANTKLQSLVEDEPQPAAYQPFSQRYEADGTFHVRASGGETAITSIRRIIRELDPAQAVDASSLSEMVDFTLWSQRSAVKLLSIFALVALLLAAIGIYGAMAFSVRLREHELGVRAALGARSSNLLSQVLSEGLLVSVGGVALGLIAAVVLGRGLRGFLFELAPYDAPTLLATALILVTVTALACLRPAVRAAQSDPIRALKEE